MKKELKHEQSHGFSAWYWPPKGATSMHQAHAHSDIEINYLLRGNLRYLIAGNSYTIKPHELVIFWGGMPHQLIDQDTDSHGIWITIPIHLFLEWNISETINKHLLSGRLLQNVQQTNENILFQKAQMMRWAEDFITDKNTFKPIIALEVEACLRRVSHQYKTTSKKRKIPPDTARLKKFTAIVQYLVKHYQDDILAEDVAQAIGMHPKYLMQFFKGVSSITLWHYLLLLRMAHAKRLLLTTEWKVIDIATESGFGSLSSFYYAFNQIYPNQKPNEWRRRPW